MTYGFRVTGADNNYQIDSSDTTPQFLAVKADGSLGDGGSPATYIAGDILFGGFDPATPTGIATVDTLGGTTDIEVVDGLQVSRRAAGTYTITASDYTTDVSGGGTGATFTVTVNGDGVTSVAITSAGDGFAIDETITIPSDKIGATAGNTAFTFDVATVVASHATKDILVNFNSSGVSPTFIDGGNYVVLRPTNTMIAAGEASETYGIQIKNSGDPQLISFDSRIMSKGMEIKEVKATNSIAGGYPGVTSWDTQTNNEVYNGTGLKDIYVGINSGSKHHGTVSGTTPPNAGANAWLGFRYIYDLNGTSGKIKLINATVANFGGANNAYVGLNNLQQIIIGKFIQ